MLFECNQRWVWESVRQKFQQQLYFCKVILNIQTDLYWAITSTLLKTTNKRIGTSFKNAYSRRWKYRDTKQMIRMTLLMPLRWWFCGWVGAWGHVVKYQEMSIRSSPVTYLRPWKEAAHNQCRNHSFLYSYINICPKTLIKQQEQRKLAYRDMRTKSLFSANYILRVEIYFYGSTLLMPAKREREGLLKHSFQERKKFVWSWLELAKVENEKHISRNTRI